MKIAPVFLLLTLAAMAQNLTDADIRKILVERIDTQRQGVGIVVGIVDAHGRRIIGHGTFDAGDPRPVDGTTIFEIGSMTKVFTSLAMMDMAQHGDIALTDPIAKYLPADVKVPERDGIRITFENLSMQSSGLPRLPNNLKPRDFSNPYADYTVAQLYQYLSSYRLPRDPGSKYEYSNVGAGLLGHVLSLRAGTDYESMVRSRILKPLEMSSTAVTLTPEMKSRLAPGHNNALKLVPGWDLPTLAGAGALRSDANDMLTFLAANLGFVESPLSSAMAAMVKTHKPTGMPGVDIAYAWHMFVRKGDPLIWHDGGTGGYQSFMGYDPKLRMAVVVLSNTSANRGVNDIGLHVLDSSFPLSEPPQRHTEIQTDPNTFDAFTGRYQLTPQMVLTISREGDHLYAQATGQGRFELFPEAEKRFFAKVAEIEIEFGADSLTLYQGGATLHAGRLTGDAAAAPARKAIALAPKVLDKYVGRYEVTPAFVMDVTLDGNHLMVQATGQDKNEIFAESEREFFSKVIDGRITFEVDGQGRVTGLVIHQGGMDTPAKRLE